MAPKGDFENRERDEGAGLSGIPLAGTSLGELPTDLAQERGDLATYVTREVGGAHPDMQRANDSRIDAGKTGLGSPALDYTVRSTYDSRPTSGRDFNLWFTTAPNVCATDTYLGFTNCFYVPLGFVAVIRKVEVLLPSNPSVATYDALLSVMINNAVVEPQNVIVGPANGDSTPSQTVGIPFRDPGNISTFLIADEGQLVGALLGGVAAFSAVTFENIYVGFHGNFLLKTGVPAQFQIANLGGKAKSAVTSSASDLKRIGPSGADMVVSRRRKSLFPNVPILRKP